MDLQEIKDELKEMYPKMQHFIQHTLVAEMCLEWHKKQEWKRIKKALILKNILESKKPTNTDSGKMDSSPLDIS